jgi:recombination protein RecR
MNKIDTLTAFFQKFPGIGGRQAKRFAYHVLTMNSADATELARLIERVRIDVLQCQSCQQYFEQHHDAQQLCAICSSNNRNHNKLMVVSFDSDIVAIERSGVYDGLYFVLGGTVPPPCGT